MKNIYVEVKNQARKMAYRTYFLLHEKQFKRVRYIFLKKSTSKNLIISFSGFPGVGKAPAYNYIRTLKDVNANQLFLLDNFGWHQDLGSYYLGEHGEWFLPDEISTLVNSIKDKHRIKRVITIGSSKGGTAALFYAQILKADYAIIGAPQYRVGDYLNTDEHRAILRAVMNDDSDAAIEKLNNLLPNVINASKYRTKVILHYSPYECMFQEHIAPLIATLKKEGFDPILDNNYTYSEHSEVSLFFPEVLKRYLGMIVNDAL